MLKAEGGRWPWRLEDGPGEPPPRGPWGGQGWGLEGARQLGGARNKSVVLHSRYVDASFRLVNTAEAAVFTSLTDFQSQSSVHFLLTSCTCSRVGPLLFAATLQGDFGEDSRKQCCLGADHVCLQVLPGDSAFSQQWGCPRFHPCA